MNTRLFFYRLSLIALLFSTLIPSAHANGINAQTLNPSVSDHYVLTEDALYSDWPKYHPWYIGVNYNYVNQPLTAISQATNSNAFNIINSIQTFDMMVAWKVNPRLGLYISLPINIVDFTGGVAGFPSGSQTAVGDLKLEAKIALSDEGDQIHWALAPEIHLPTGSTADFVSDSSVYGALKLVAETWLAKYLEIAGNIGYGYSPDATISTENNLQGFDDRNRLLLGIGSLIKFNDQWGANVEFSAQELFPTSQSQNPNDLYAGLRFLPAECLILTAGGAVGKLGQNGGENYRLLAGLRYSPGSKPEPTPKPTPYPTPLPVATPTPSPVPAPAIRASAQKIELLKPVLFENNSAKIMTESKWILDEVIDAIHKFPKRYAKLYVDGHTNHIGPRPHNVKLSIARAKSVKRYLVSKGIPESHLIARGFGPDRPIYKLSDERAVEGNRRVEFNVAK